MIAISDIYRDAIRYQPETLYNIYEHIKISALYPIQRLVEIGVGTGYALEVASRSFLDTELVGIDIIPDMLKRAEARNYKTKPKFVLSSAEMIGLPDKHSSFTYACCAFHLFQEKVSAASEMLRITDSGGLIAVIGYSHADLQTQVFHKFFPDFSSRELDYHPEPSIIANIFQSLGGTIISVTRTEFSITFKNTAEVLKLIEERQFFGLRTMPDDIFNIGKIKFKSSLINTYKDNPVRSVSALTTTLIRT
ncbi:class I SAM-dependent methyltransferase [Azospirillum argentinense]|uniref:Class I SAM-dependent methyltransferase n=1 Tax=Azospirillum brasilense TaxID=192 RepID=A0A4D8QF00_AZOBR|nr:class I SAM-dependent methyltransferase [Azospirillum argentinense]QCO06750.1 class I SAM-dependent methyltransferase [Azospirillum argentinense]